MSLRVALNAMLVDTSVSASRDAGCAPMVTSTAGRLKANDANNAAARMRNLADSMKTLLVEF